MTTAPRMTERQLQDAIIQCAGYLGWRTYHTWLSARSAPGWPDIIAVRTGRLLAIEVKNDRYQPTPHQIDWLELLGTVPGVESYLWRPADWRDGTIERVLRGDA